MHRTRAVTAGVLHCRAAPASRAIVLTVGRMSNMPITHFVHSPVACWPSCLYFYALPFFPCHRSINISTYFFFPCRLHFAIFVGVYLSGCLFILFQPRCVYEVLAESGFETDKLG